MRNASNKQTSKKRFKRGIKVLHHQHLKGKRKFPHNLYMSIQVSMPWEPITALVCCGRSAVWFYQHATRSSKSECRRERWLPNDSIVDNTSCGEYERLCLKSVLLPFIHMYSLFHFSVCLFLSLLTNLISTLPVH